MTALGLRRRPLRPAIGVRALLLGAIVAVWTGVVSNAFLGFVPMAVPSLLLVTVGMPLLLAAAVLLQRGEARPELRLAAGWTALVAAALLAALYVPSQPRLGLAIPAVVVSAWVCSRRPAGALVAAFLLTGTFGSLQVFTPLPVGETVDLVLAGLWIGVIWRYLVSGQRRALWLWPGIVAGVLYLVVTAVAIATAEDLYDGLYAFRVSAWYMLAFILIGFAGWRQETYRKMALGFVGVAALVGAYATFRWIVGPADKELEAALAIAPQYEIVNGEPRLFGSFANGKELAAWTAAIIPLCAAVALVARGRWRLLAVVAFVLCAVGLFGSETRAALVAVVAGLATVLVLYQLARASPGLHLGLTAAAVIAILGAGFVVFSQTAGDDDAGAERYRVLLTDPTGDPAYQGRIYKWGDALDDLEGAPFGNGLGSAGQAHVRYGRFVNIASSDIDNSYLTIAYQQGFLVAGLYVLTLLLLVIGLARRAIATKDRERAALAVGACGALVSYGVILWTAGYYEGLTALATWMIFGLGVAQVIRPARRDGEPAA